MDDIEAVEGIEEGEDFLCRARLLDCHVGGVYLHDAGTMVAHDAAHLGVLHRGGRRDFQQRRLLQEYLVVGIEASLQHINALLDLRLQHLHHLFGAVARDGVFMHAGRGAGAYVQALDIDLSAREHRRHLVQNTGEVFGEDQNGI